ncbi:mitochondrial inner membrane protein OXA1L-like [Tropilaelaps mercedesae]|uniref:Mitochondrial inner membrane protein OXA1L-like n=1 Tax=Tropilaelaps mercedesae TaxID=418985 RepID=A0A1V9WZB9_9ACAR|nr:mitochondrial inner membrane protein OXA1L-like [Tropilaelaps mercedesae]
MLLYACRIAARRGFGARLRMNTSQFTESLSLVRSLSTTDRVFAAESVAAGSSASVEYQDGPSSAGTSFHSPSDVLNDPALYTNAAGDLDLSKLAEGLSSDLISAGGGTPSLTDLGLGGWTPSGLLQTALNELHQAGLPWWASIAISTLAIRLLMFPLVIKCRRNALRLNNYMPEVMALQLRMTEARIAGNYIEIEKAANDLMAFYKEKDVSPLKGFIPAFLQASAPFFISFFFALKGMANLPMESMKVGGLSWFTDLTVPDPLYILPLLTSVTVFAALEVGAETGVKTNQMNRLRMVLRVIPFAMFPLTMSFPAAVLCYWATSNTFTLCQVAFLNIPAVSRYFDIPDAIHHATIAPPMTLDRQKLLQSFREAVKNAKITSEVEERARLAVMREMRDEKLDGKKAKSAPRQPDPIRVKAIEHKGKLD